VNVSAIIVTRGNVDLTPILNSLPPEWEIVIWDNERGMVSRYTRHRDQYLVEAADGDPLPDLAVYGRYAAIQYATHDLIYVQDDDVIVSDPQAIVDAWDSHLFESRGVVEPPPHVVANMPQEFRHDGYTDSCLVGFGACFHRDLPGRAFDRFTKTVPTLELSNYGWWLPPEEKFLRACDVVFTTLAPRVLVDVPRTDMAYATNSTRMYRQPGHLDERTRMLALARKVRDG
jgi:hypothetical protein